MEITRYYPTRQRTIVYSDSGIRLDKTRVETKDGKQFYLTQRVFRYISKDPGISNIELFVNISRDVGEIIFPVNEVINLFYRKIKSTTDNLTLRDYVRRERIRLPRYLEDLYYRIAVVNKGIRSADAAPRTFEYGNSEIPIKKLSFDEMLKQSVSTIGFIAPFLMSPRTLLNLSKELGLVPNSIIYYLGGIRYFRLLNWKENRYYLTEKPERRQQVLKLLLESQLKKERYANRMKRYIKTYEMLENNYIIDDISLLTGLSNTQINSIKNERPKFRSRLVEILVSDGLLDKFDEDRLRKFDLVF